MFFLLASLSAAAASLQPVPESARSCMDDTELELELETGLGRLHDRVEVTFAQGLGDGDSPVLLTRFRAGPNAPWSEQDYILDDATCEALASLIAATVVATTDPNRPHLEPGHPTAQLSPGLGATLAASPGGVALHGRLALRIGYRLAAELGVAAEAGPSISLDSGVRHDELQVLRLPLTLGIDWTGPRSPVGLHAEAGVAASVLGSSPLLASRPQPQLHAMVAAGPSLALGPIELVAALDLCDPVRLRMATDGALLARTSPVSGRFFLSAPITLARSKEEGVQPSPPAPGAP